MFDVSFGVNVFLCVAYNKKYDFKRIKFVIASISIEIKQ